MGFDFFSGNNQQTIRFILLTIILITLPCYCLGAVLLASAPDDQKDTPATRENGLPPLGGSSAQISPSPRSGTPTSTRDPLRPTPTQLIIYASPTQFVWPTWTMTMTPTFEIIPPTSAPTFTSIPLPTLAPSATLEPSATTAPPTDAPTDAPVPTDAPLEPSPTQEGLIPEPPTQSS